MDCGWNDLEAQLGSFARMGGVQMGMTPHVVEDTAKVARGAEAMYQAALDSLRKEFPRAPASDGYTADEFLVMVTNLALSLLKAQWDQVPADVEDRDGLIAYLWQTCLMTYVAALGHVSGLNVQFGPVGEGP